MAEESVSNKLSELFDLHKSGALTKEEYDLLKSQIIGTGVSSEPPKAEKVIQTSNEKESIHESSTEAESESKHELTSNKLNQTTAKPSANKPDKVDLDSGSKTKINWIVIIVFLLLVVIAGIYIVTKRSNGNLAVQDNGLSTLNENIPIKNIPIVENKAIVWDEAAATKIIMDELSKFPEWSKSANDDSAKWFHEIISFNKLIIGKKEIMVGLAFSNYEGNSCNACYGEVSIFEFENDEKLILTRKSIAFTIGGAGGTAPDRMAVYKISQDNYGLLVAETAGNQGYNTDSKDLYSFNNGEFRHILSESQPWSANDLSTHSMALNFIINNDRYYDIEIIKKDKPEQGEEVVETSIYKFNGTVYEKGNNIVSDLKRDPRAKDVANVFWNPEFTLFCKLTDEPISPKNDGKYDIWYSSHEEPYPHHKILTKDELPNLLFYKFKDYETCKDWCDAKNQSK